MTAHSRILQCCVLTILMIGTSTSLPAQGTSELDKRNGFKSIKLGNPIDSVRGAVFKKDFLEGDEFTAKLYETEDPEYLSVGVVPVRKIKVMTYKNLVYKIAVTTDKDPRVMQALEKAYGQATYVMKTASYNWKSDILSLTFAAQSNTIQLTYRCYPVLKMMAQDKGKKLEKIAEDF